MQRREFLQIAAGAGAAERRDSDPVLKILEGTVASVGVAAMLVHQRVTTSGTHDDLARACLPVTMTVLARLVDVEVVVCVLHGRHDDAAACRRAHGMVGFISHGRNVHLSN